MADGERNLNEEQLQAVEHGQGPLLIIAGAGTGKTTVVTERIKHLISSELAKPSEILALTFTEKAAREMEERVDIAMPYGYTQMWIATFHAFCDRILRNEALNIGLSPHYNLLTQTETIQYFRQNFFEFELDYFRPLGNPHKFIESILQHFSRLKDEDILPEDYLVYAAKLAEKKEMTDEEKEEAVKTMELAKAYQTYEALKARDEVFDFSDLIANVLKVLRTRKSILKQYQDQFKYILVDEFQDTNYAQYILLKLLAPPESNPNLTVVGDDSQSIYKFRGAAISNILQLMKEYKNVKQVVLTKNYRSTQTILDHSYQLIKNNDPDTLEAQLGISKNLQAVRKVEEEPIGFIYKDRVENEAEEVTKTILHLKHKKLSLKYSDFAVLVRANNHAEPFMRAFDRANIPYKFLGPGALFRQPEIKDLIAYLKILVNFEDSLSMYRVLSMDYLQINSRDIAALFNYSLKNKISLFEVCEKQEEVKIAEETRTIVKKLVETIHKHLGLLTKETAGQILYYFLEEMGILAKMTNPEGEGDSTKAQNISKLFDRLKAYEAQHEDSSVFVVSDWIDLAMEMGESPQVTDNDWSEVDAVNILTVHSSKGLEFPIVFLVNLVAQRFPTMERREKIPIPEALIKEILPEGDYHLEEERRLFYVGITRARDQLYLTAANYYGEGKRERKLSPFVNEALGAQALEKSIYEEDTQLVLPNWPSQQVNKTNPSLTPINRLTYSQIETFKQCPYHFKLRYLLNIPSAPSAAQSFGTSLHDALKDYYEAKLANEVVGETELLSFLKKNWHIEGYENQEHAKLSFNKAQEILSNYYQKIIAGEKELPIAIEQEFSFLVNNLCIEGRVDRINFKDGKLEIVDYKTGNNILEQKEADKDLQLTIYALAATEIKNVPFNQKPEDVTLSLFYLEKGQKVSTTRTYEQLSKAKEELLDWQQKISQSDFSCNKSEMCKYCEYRLLCDAY